jgi:hypothetical protein
MAPATEKSYGEAGVLLATDYDFSWWSLPFANCMISLWRNEGQVDASIGIAFFFMAACGRHLSPD